MTRNATRIVALIRSKGLACRYNSATREYRIAPNMSQVSAAFPTLNYKEIIGKIEACAYYTDCEHDAANTANMMINTWKDK